MKGNRYPGSLFPTMGKQPCDIAQDKDTYNPPDNRFYPRTLMGVKCHVITGSLIALVSHLYGVILGHRFLPAPAYPLPDSLMEIVRDSPDTVKSQRYHGGLRPIMGEKPGQPPQNKDTYD